LNQYYQESIILGEKIVLEKQIYKQYEDTKNYHAATIITLAKLAESRDLLTGNHINRVSELSYLLAKELPDSMYKDNNLAKEEFLDTIILSSSLHDIGKIAISDTILNKPGKLTKEEFEVIKTHTTKGYDMLKEIEKDYDDNMFLSLGLQISKSHHERWDGGGYPEGLRGNEIPLAARIVAVVDVYDALISERPYKKAFSKEKSLKIIEEGVGSHFDPVISNIFIEFISQSYI
jgi:putative two-component system response regulator